MELRLFNKQEIVNKFGYFKWQEGRNGMIVIDKDWVKYHIVELRVDKDIIRCHIKVRDELSYILSKAKELGIKVDLEGGGCYVPRHILWDRKRGLSSHSWGIAIDINVKENKVGTVGKQDKRLIELFNEKSWVWGGDFKLFKDPMHFEKGVSI